MPLYSWAQFYYHLAMGESGNVLSVSGLTVKFGEHAIIDNLSFEVKRDTTIAIVGPN